jgi:hypothetical protein
MAGKKFMKTKILLSIKNLIDRKLLQNITKYFVVVALIVIGSLMLIFNIKLFVVNVNERIAPTPKVDLNTFMGVSRLVRSGRGASMYDYYIQRDEQIAYLKITPEEMEGVIPFKSIPLVAALFVPLSYLDYSKAYLVLIIINLLLLFASLIIIRKITHTSIYLILLIPLLSLPNYLTLINGQVSLLLLFIFSLTIFYIHKEKYLLAGIVAAFIAIKFQHLLAVSLILCLVNDKRTFLKGFVFSTMIIALISLRVVGFNTFINYPKFVMMSENLENADQMFSLQSFFDQLPTINHLVEITTIASLVFYLFILFAFYRRSKKLSFEVNISVLFILSCIASIHVLAHDLVVFQIPAMFLLGGRVSSISKSYLGLFFIMMIIPYFRIINVSYIGTIVMLLLGVSLLIGDKTKHVQSNFKFTS